jgi:SAM-dependent methyltransferase
MVERKAATLKETPEDISATIRRLDLKKESFYDIVSSHPAVRKLYEKAVEASGLEKMERAVVLDVGSGGGVLKQVIEEKCKGKDITVINLDYNPLELKKGKGNRILADKTKPPIADESVDVAFILNVTMPASRLGRVVSKYYPTDSFETLEKKNLLIQIGGLYLHESQAPVYLALKALKKEGKLVTSMQVDELLDLERSPSLKERLINPASGITCVRREKREGVALGEEVPVLFKLFDPEAPASRNFIIDVFVKKNNDGIEEALRELEGARNDYLELLKISLETGILAKLRKEGKL